MHHGQLSRTPAAPRRMARQDRRRDPSQRSAVRRSQRPDDRTGRAGSDRARGRSDRRSGLSMLLRLFAHAAGALSLILGPAVSARADDTGDIRARLEQWTDDFNAGRIDKICDLFSKDAISNYRGQPERTYEEICDLLKRSLADPAKKFHYELDLREVIVERDLAVVRLVWTLFISPLNVTSAEPGMDVFRREADGKWRIIRYLAFEASP